MKDDPVPDDHHVSRYCSPDRVLDDRPLASAFEISEGLDYLSVNWLEYWGLSDLHAELDRVRDEFVLQVSRNGRFVVLEVSQIKTAVSQVARRPASVTHQPTPEMASHAGVFGYLHSEREVATILATIGRPENVFPAIGLNS